MKLPYDPAILLLGIYPKKPEMLIWKNMFTPVFIAALFTITKMWTQPKCPSVDEWIKQLGDIYTMEYYLAVKKEENLTFATAWMDPESIILSEMRHSEKDKTIWFPSYVEPNEQNKLTNKIETDS